MSDRFPVQVNIGGPVTLDLLKDIVGIAQNEGFGRNWEWMSSEEILLKHTLQVLHEGNGKIEYLDFNCNELAYEAEKPLTDFLIDKGIPYEAMTGPRYEYAASMHWWRPGMKHLGTWSHFDGDTRTVTISLEQLIKWKKRKRGLADVIKFLEAIPPPMPPFELIDWKPELVAEEKQEVVVVTPSEGAGQLTTMGSVEKPVDTP